MLLLENLEGVVTHQQAGGVAHVAGGVEEHNALDRGEDGDGAVLFRVEEDVRDSSLAPLLVADTVCHAAHPPTSVKVRSVRRRPCCGVRVGRCPLLTTDEANYSLPHGPVILQRGDQRYATVSTARVVSAPLSIRYRRG